jgi:tetratricopeptide (TPR) repeat protein
MRSWNPFKKKSKEKEESMELDPTELPEPNEYEGFMRRAWAYHAKGDLERAESDFRRAISYSPESVDANFALGLNLKSQDKTEEAIEAFNNTMKLIEAGRVENDSKKEMLRRLTLGHINELTIGDWNLEEEIWHKE